MTRASVARLTLTALAGVPLIEAGDDLLSVLQTALAASTERLLDGDILVLAQKIVSKAEGRAVDLASVTPSERALRLAAETGKNPRLVELILRESRAVLRHRPGVLIVEHRLGLVLANAGIDASNVGAANADTDQRVLLLPENPDRSSAELRERIRAGLGVAVGVIINDSLGRAWRLGTVGAALGVSGLPALLDLRGRGDLFGRRLQSTEVGLADELAAAASLLMGQADEARPIVLIRGLDARGVGQAADLLRPPALDLFR